MRKAHVKPELSPQRWHLMAICCYATTQLLFQGTGWVGSSFVAVVWGDTGVKFDHRETYVCWKTADEREGPLTNLPEQFTFLFSLVVREKSAWRRSRYIVLKTKPCFSLLFCFLSRRKELGMGQDGQLITQQLTSQLVRTTGEFVHFFYF